MSTLEEQFAEMVSQIAMGGYSMAVHNVRYAIDKLREHPAEMDPHVHKFLLAAMDSMLLHMVDGEKMREMAARNFREAAKDALAELMPILLAAQKATGAPN